MQMRIQIGYHNATFSLRQSSSLGISLDTCHKLLRTQLIGAIDKRLSRAICI